MAAYQRSATSTFSNVAVPLPLAIWYICIDLKSTVRLELLRDQNLTAQCDEGSVTQDEHSAKIILFDVSHGELLETQSQSIEQSDAEEEALEKEDPEDEQQDEKQVRAASQEDTKLIQYLRKEFEPRFKVDPGSPPAKALVDKELNPEEIKVLVLGAPQKLFTKQEVEAIISFVYQGGSLLIAHNYNSLFEQEQQLYNQEQSLQDRPPGVSINELMRAFGLGFKRLLSYPPGDISTLYPHYVSSDVNKIFLREPVYLEVLENLPKTLVGSPQIVARFPKTNEALLVAVEVEYGRVIAIGDYALFQDDYIDYGSHQQLILNLFHWLTEQNYLDCFDVSIQSEVCQGETATFSMALKNPQPERLEHIHCLLESEVGAEIIDPEKRIRSLAPYAHTRLQWTVEPKQLGLHTLKLTIELPRIKSSKRNQTLFFDTAAKFECLPDGEIDLVILNQSGEMRGVVETGQPFEVMAVLRKTIDLKDAALQFRLDSPSPHLVIEELGQAGTSRWRLNALNPGELPLRMIVGKTGKHLPPYVIHARPSLQDQIRTIEQTLQLLTAQAHCYVTQIRREFDSEEIRHIPCHLYTPEAQVQLLNSRSEAELQLEALRVARQEDRTGRSLVEYLLDNIAPTFSPGHGCCIPYDPKLATRLSRQHPLYEDNLAQNFLILEGQESRLEQNLTALVLHEKYGHGFFFTQTTLGRQLAILDRQGMMPIADIKQLKAPYPRFLYEKYRSAIQALWDSSIIVNEGFSAWVELSVLPRFGGAIAESAYRRKDFLFNRDHKLDLLASNSEYFENFPPFCSSRYREGCEYLQLIQGYFGEECGPKCAVQTMLKAADVDVGITESGGQVQFALDADIIESSLLNAPDNNARSDIRLRQIHSVLHDAADKIRAEQEQLQCHQECLHLQCPINRSIREKLGW